MKLGHKAMHHKMNPKQLNLYAEKFLGRSKMLESDTIVQMGTVIKIFRSRRLRYNVRELPTGMDSGARM